MNTENYSDFAYLGIIQILLVLSLSLFFFMRPKVDSYRQLVTKPEDLVKPGSRFLIFQYADNAKSFVKVFGRDFVGEQVCSVAYKDALFLCKRGYKLSISYYSATDALIPRDSIAHNLEVYSNKIKEWADSNQGRPHKSDRPAPPYEYSITTLQAT